MMKMKYSLFAIAFLLLNNNLFAQTSKTGTIVKGADVNFTDLANYYRIHPTVKVRKPLFDEDGDKESRPLRTADPSMVKLIHRAEAGATTATPHTALLPSSPAPADTFQSTVSDGFNIPPDTHGAVDSTYCVTAINDSVVIRTRAGAYVSGVGLDNFWSSLETTYGTGAYDPRIHYDPHFKRWIFVTDCYGETVNSTIFIAVSATGDPTGTWHMYSVYVGDAAGDWLDFPCVGFNNKWVAVSGNIFSSSDAYNNDVVYVFNYADLRSGTASAAYTALYPTGGSFCIAPALTYDTSESNMYAVESYNGSAGQLQLWKISGAVGSPAITTVANPSTTTHWQSQGNSGGDFAPQSGSGGTTTYLLQTNDDRVNNLQQRNGKLWCAHTVFLPASGTATHSSAMWWEIDTTGSPVQNGMVNDATAHIFYAFPSIAVNTAGDALMGFAYLSSSVHPSAAYSLHMHTDPNDSMRPAVVFRHGQKEYFQNFGSGDDRWGDYSATCIDPRNNLDFWTIQESVPNYSGGLTNSLWDTWWAYVQLCATLTAPAGGTTATTQCAGTTATYTISPVTGATGYTWTVSGTGWSGTSTTTSIVLTAGTGVATVTAAANNSCGAGAAYTFTVNGVATPVAPTISVVTAPCVGSASAAFAASSGSATSYSWQVIGTGWSGSSTTSSITTTVGTSTAKIIAKGINSCGTGPADTLTIAPGTVPSAATAIDTPASMCASSIVTFTATPVSGATSYTWTVSGTGWSGASTTNTISLTTGTAPASVTVTPVNGCGSGAPYTLSSVVPVIVATPSYAVTSHVTHVNTNDLFTYTGAVLTGATYTWNFAGGLAVPGGTGVGPNTVKWTTTGLKTITLSVTDNGCTSAIYTDTVLVTSATGVLQLAADAINVSIQPNPNDGNFNILFDKDINKSINVKIVDMNGRIVYANDFNATSGKKLKITTANLPPATYTVSVGVEGAVANNKITVTR